MGAILSVFQPANREKGGTKSTPSLFFRPFTEFVHGISTDIFQIRIESMARASCRVKWEIQLIVGCPPVEQKSKVITILGILETQVTSAGAIADERVPGA